MSTGDSRRGSISKKKKLVFFLVLAVLIYIPAEIVHRVLAFQRYEKLLQKLYPAYAEDERLGYVFVPGDFEGQTQGTEIDFFYHINALGLRGPDIDEAKSPGTVRVLCLGGSTTFGTGCLTDDASYPSQLQRALRRRITAGKLQAKDVEVLNAGVPGYRSAESILQLERYRHLQPDIVIVYHGINDITWGDDSEFYKDPLNQARPEERLQRVRRRAHSTLVSALWHRLTHRRREKPEGAGCFNYPTARSGFEGNLATLADKVSAMGAIPVFLTFETQLREELGEEIRDAVDDEPSYSMSFSSLDEGLRAFDLYNESVRKVSRDKGASLIDVSGAIPPDRSLWSDFCHLTDSGTSLLVREISPHLEKIIAAREEGTSAGGEQ